MNAYDKPRPWTPQDDAALLSMRNAGMPYPAIGKQLGRSHHACKGRHHTITNECNINARRYRDLGAPIPPDRDPKPINDAGYIQKCREAGGFRGLEFTPGRVFVYVNRRPFEVMLSD